MQKLFRLLDHKIKYFVAVALLMVPLFPKFPFIRVPGTFVSIRLEDFVLAFLGMLLVIEIARKPQRFLKLRVGRAIVMFLLVSLVSLFSAVFVTKSVVPHIGLLHFLRRIEYLIPFFIGYVALSKNRSDLAFYFNIFIIVVIISFIYGFGQKHFSWPVIITQNQEYAKGVALRWIPGSHINSTFAGHYDLATYLVLVLPSLLTALVLLDDRKIKILLFFSLIAGLWLLTNSVSRISIVSYLLSISISLFLINKGKLIPLVVIGSLILFSFSPGLKARYFRVFEVVRIKLQSRVDTSKHFVLGQVYAAPGSSFSIKPKRIAPTPTPTPVFEDRSSSIRLNVEWPRAIRAFGKNPLLGTGYSSIGLATDNDYLRLLGEVGILGFAAFLLIFARIIVLMLSRLPLDKHWQGLELAFLAGTAGSLVGILLNATFIDVFEASKFAVLFWFNMGFAANLLQRVETE